MEHEENQEKNNMAIIQAIREEISSAFSSIDITIKEHAEDHKFIKDFKAKYTDYCKDHEFVSDLRSGLKEIRITLWRAIGGLLALIFGCGIVALFVLSTYEKFIKPLGN